MEHGFGTTHVSLTLANFICNKLGMKTAYIEFNATNQISSLCKVQGNQFFSYKGIDFFPNTSVTSLSEILRDDYRYFILDMGVLNTYTTKEFLRCDKQFLVCSPSKWRQSQAKEKIEALLKNNIQNRVTVIMNLSEEESYFSIFPKAYKQVSFPYIANPFQLKPNHFHVIDQILE